MAANVLSTWFWPGNETPLLRSMRNSESVSGLVPGVATAGLVADSQPLWASTIFVSVPIEACIAPRSIAVTAAAVTPDIVVSVSIAQREPFSVDSINEPAKIISPLVPTKLTLEVENVPLPRLVPVIAASTSKSLPTALLGSFEL